VVVAVGGGDVAGQHEVGQRGQGQVLATRPTLVSSMPPYQTGTPASRHMW
jgi:hypothetical protein